MTKLSQSLTSFWLLSQTFTNNLSPELYFPLSLLSFCS